MGIGYILVNRTKREKISFLHLPVNTAREIAGHPASAALSTWYLLSRSGDEIAFVDDHSGHSAEGLHEYREMTDTIIGELVDAGILEDRGVSFRDPQEPDLVYIRDLRVCWMNESAHQHPRTGNRKTDLRCRHAGVGERSAVMLAR
ncbi:hypothetical protein [Polyangium sp. 15x6]|uniref:hypothetical protein n=1 Tax=Polyangium sp. 15x6 TaxID=3042687 RepID=UPI00249B16A6|nr:hypothetical protein [Polyangium sp. 15x6]MDI3287298.1 hypothetical protein [Polyangium sp. 15x6]